MVVGALAVVPVGVADGGPHLLDPALLAAGFAVALASSVIPYSLELEALRRLPTRVFGVLMSLDPAIAAAAGFIVLGQDLGDRAGDRHRARGHRERRRVARRPQPHRGPRAVAAIRSARCSR